MLQRAKMIKLDPEASSDSGASVPEVGRMVDCGQADDRRMIGLVRARPLLYARNNMPVASYYTQVKALWEEVADEMGWTVADVRRKWSHIRNSYSRHLRNEMHGARTGKGRIVSRWYLADELEFLRDHMATDTRASPYSSYPPTMLKMDLDTQEQQPDSEYVDVKPFIHSPWFLQTPPSQKPETKLESLLQSEDSSNHSQNLGAEDNSSYFNFFKGIYNDYQELSVSKQRKFRRQCLNFLHDLLDEEDSQITISSFNQRDALNLSSSAQGSEDEKDIKVKCESYILPSTS